ncbi:MAG: hypothetical protein CR986_01420 [Ignavibacteriae bacterium]|nr:MAG: hypothetical protein CR986_01420 [Ignavibacteriota bacterium]
MNAGLGNAEIAMRNKIRNMQVVANNLANINTTGFKRGLAFSEVFNEQNKTLKQEVTDFTEGVFEETNNPLNAAISGNSYFTVQTPNGEEITRNGSFKVDKEGFLATQDGYRVLTLNGEINLENELIDNKQSLTITENGLLRLDDKIIGKLKIVTVEDQTGLKKSDGERFYNKERYYTVANEEDFEIHQGYLESSNTNAILEMQEMIQLQKDYEASHKMVTSLDNILALQKDIGKI